MRDLGDVDAALLPIGGMDTMDTQEAVTVAIEIGPKAAIPMHRRKADPQEFKREVEAKSKSDIRVVPLQIGGVYQFA